MTKGSIGSDGVVRQDTAMTDENQFVAQEHQIDATPKDMSELAGWETNPDTQPVSVVQQSARRVGGVTFIRNTTQPRETEPDNLNSAAS